MKTHKKINSKHQLFVLQAGLIAFIFFLTSVSCDNSINDKKPEAHIKSLSVASTKDKPVNEKKELQVKSNLETIIVYSDSVLISLDSLDFTDSIIIKRFGDTLSHKIHEYSECWFYPKPIIIKDSVLYKVYLNDSVAGFIKEKRNKDEYTRSFAEKLLKYKIDKYEIILKEECIGVCAWFDYPILLRNDSVIKRFGSFGFNSSEWLFDSLLIFHNDYGLSIIDPLAESKYDFLKSSDVCAYTVDKQNKSIFFLEAINPGIYNTPDSLISIGEYHIDTDSIQYLFSIKSDTLKAGIEGADYYYNFKVKNTDGERKFSFWTTILDSIHSRSYITVNEMGVIKKVEKKDY